MNTFIMSAHRSSGSASQNPYLSRQKQNANLSQANKLQPRTDMPKFGNNTSLPSTCDVIERQLSRNTANANPSGLNASFYDTFPDVLRTYQKLKSEIAKHSEKQEEALEKHASKFRNAGNQALYKPEMDLPRFNTRSENLNKIPLFYSAFGTEIPKPEELKALPPKEKQSALIRLIGKRYLDIDETENKYTSFLNKYGIGKSSPTMQMQDMPTRLIRGEAGTASVNQYSGKYIQDLYDHVVKNVQLPANSNSPATIYLVRPGRDKYATDCSTNFLTLATHGIITDALNDLARRNGMAGRIRFSDQKQLPNLNRSSRTNSTPIERIVLQGYYDTSQIKKGDQVVLVDDHCQAGGTFLGMAAAVTNAGAHVLAAATPTVHPLSSTFSLSPDVKALLHETLKKWDPKGVVQKKLGEYGIPLSTLTNHEALIIIAYATDPEDKAAKQAFKDLETKLYENTTVLSGESDSLEPVLEKKPLTPETVAANMETASVSARKITRPVPIQAVHVLDWDDFLSDEKSKNYELMHRAIAVSAHNYGDKYPFFISLAKAVQENRGNYKVGMPELCMDEKAYSHQAIQKDRVLKRDSIKDLLAHLDKLSPDLKKQFEAIGSVSQDPQHRLSAKTLKVLSNPALSEKQTSLSGQQAIDNILWAEFKRQYHSMLEPNAPKMPNRLKYGLELPFPDVRPTLMPGAADLLEKLRRPENFVILLSNRPEAQLTKELNAMGLAHFFDVTSGEPSVLVSENGKERIGGKQFRKPNPGRLNDIISQQHHLDNASWNFWGDTGKDVTQAIPLIQEGKLPANRVKGFLINPNTKLWDDLNHKVKTDVPELNGIDIVSAKTLTDLLPH